MVLFKQNPLLKLLVPLVAGIAVGWMCNIGLLHIVPLLAVAAVALLVGLLHFSPRWLFGAGAVGLMFAAGAFVELRQCEEKDVQWSSVKSNYKARLLEVPDVRGTSVRVLADVCLADSSFSVAPKGGRVYLYFSRSLKSDSLSIGDSIFFEGVVSPPRNAGNPAEFDIEKYYYIKGISGTAFLYDDAWQFGNDAALTFPMQALLLREKVVAKYASLGFSGDELALLSALTVGEKRDLNQDVKEEYSAAGASHILALSGLHLGIIYALLMFFVPRRVRNRFVAIACELCVVLVLWCFVFVAGLSPSVVRAAILFSLMSLGRCFSRDSSSISSLAFAAIAMLLCSPHLLFDISFQLSFAAVFSILLLAPPLQQVLGVYRHGRLYGYLANLFIMSFAAQLGTLPFIWYHFGVFPLYFLLTNLFVVPMAFVVIAFALFVLLLSCVPFIQQPFAELLNVLVEAMNGGVSFVADLPAASFSLPPVDVWGAFGVALFICCMASGLLRRRWWLVAVCLSSMFLLVAFFAFRDYAKEKCDRIIIYNNRKNPLVHAIASNDDNWLVSTVPQLDAEYEYSSSPYINREALPVPEWACWSHASSSLLLDEGLLSFGGLKVRLLDNANWRENIYAEPVDVLLLCRGFLGPVSEVLDAYPTNCLVLDASLYKRSRERIMRECAALGIEPVDISHAGAIMLLPAEESFVVEPLRGK